MILFNIIFGLLVTLVVFGCYIIAISFTVWMVVDAGKQDRFWWLAVIIGVPLIGSAIYYFTEKKHEYVRTTPHHIHDSLNEQQHESSPKKKHHKKNKKEEIKEEVSVEKIEEVTEHKAENNTVIE